MRAIPAGRSQRTLLPENTETEYAYSTPTDEVHLRDYWKILVKRRRLIALVFVLVVGIGAYVTFSATPMYTATSILKIEPQNPTVTGIAEVLKLAEGGGNYDYYQTEFRLLESRSLADKIIKDLRLDSNNSFTGARVIGSDVIARIKSSIFGNLQFIIFRVTSWLTFSSNSSKKTQTPPISPVQTTEAKSELLDKTADVSSPWVGHYMGFLRVNPVKSTRLVEIRFTTPDPTLSQMLANAHIRGFIRMNLETRFELTKEARDFLDGKNSDLKKKLERSEAALNRFRQAHGVVSMEKGENIVVNRLVDLNQQLTIARTQRIEAESLYKSVEKKSSQNLAQVVTQGLVPTLRANLQALETERVKLSSTFKPDHPRMIDLNQQINEAKRSIAAEIANVVRGIEESYAAARVKEQALQAEANKQQQQALDLKEVGVEYAVLEEEVKVNRALYENVLNRLHETSVSNDLAISNMQITQLAEKPGGPSSPDVSSNLALSAAFGLFLGVGLVFFLEYLDSTLNTPEHVWRAVALATFGVVPDLNSFKPSRFDYRRLPGAGLIGRLPFLKLSSPSDPPHELIVEHHPLSIVTEAYRSIRTALLFSQAEKPPQVILVTSPSPSEGKTVTTLNLAIALAQDGYKVLVIDADLRKGCCHSRLHLRNHKGLSNILTGNLPVQDGIQETSVSGLSLLSRGICPPNPSDLLGSHKMREVVSCLRDSFNFILIDSPPAVAVSDASVLTVVSDGVFLVLHGQKTTTASARRVVARLDAVRAPLLGVILNGIDLSNPDYAYYRPYYGSDYAIMEGNGDDNHRRPTETVNRAELEEAEVLKPELGPGIVSREFFGYMTSRLTEAAGPLAPVIVQDQISFLGESLEAFPKSRLKELLERVSEEILDKNLRESFHNAMAHEIQSLRRSENSTREADLPL